MWIIDKPIAHRGLHTQNDTVENTLEAFEFAAQKGYGIECDIQCLIDGTVVVFHDDNAYRLLGVDRAIADMTIAEYKQARFRKTGEAPPTLVEVLEAVGGKASLFLDAKASPRSQHALIKGTAYATEGYLGNVAFMSFQLKLLRLMQEHRPTFSIGLVGHGDDEIAERRYRQTTHLSLAFIAYKITDLPVRWVSEMRDEGVPILGWIARKSDQLDQANRFCDQVIFEDFMPL